MSTCPRCGAMNKAGRSSCWHCWFPLPVTPPAPVERDDPPQGVPATPASTLSPTQSTEVPAPQAVPVIPQEEQTSDAACAPDEPCLQEEQGPALASEEIGREFTYVSQPVRQAEERGTNWLLIVTVLVTLLLLAAVLVWYQSLRGSVRPSAADDVARQYLSALKSGDVSLQQQLACDESKAVRFPHWLIIADAQPTGVEHTQGRLGTVPVALSLLPAHDAETLREGALRSAISQRYQVTLTLRQEAAGWRVDQQALLHDMQRVIVAENPDVHFPNWE